MFTPPTNLGYQYMLLPTQAQQQFTQQGGGTTPAQAPPSAGMGTNPQMGLQQNLLANQQQQQSQQTQSANPLNEATAAIGAINKAAQPTPPANPLNGNTPPLSGSLQNPAPNNQGAMDSYNRLAAGDNTGPMQQAMSSGLTASNLPWLQRQMGIPQMFGSGGALASFFGG